MANLNTDSAKERTFDAIVIGSGMSGGWAAKELTQKGLKPMESIGNPFDAELHEAITNIPAPTEEWKGKVVDEMEKGYLLNDKVIRFAKVIVGA